MLDEIKTVALKEVGALVAEQARMQAELQEKLQGRIGPILQGFLADHPEVKALCWTQYVPYFNDGEECVFSVNGLNYSVVDERENHHYGEGWLEVTSYRQCEEVSADTHLALNELENLLTSGPMEDTLQAIFGSHAKITVTSAGVEVEEYDHD
ncbi:hypothetical protein [Dyella telluris]|uniref:Uncharacterized protein n=1 Tax=Dyella telluris TaxID=2763498 RepID=A0A7G8Q4L3_9GAMM|nr:hypothetical protein [Dyella telluris]QNK01721.1 hypothetical protein H8F01_00630 [Dyella telluris]